MRASVYDIVTEKIADVTVAGGLGTSTLTRRGRR